MLREVSEDNWNTKKESLLCCEHTASFASSIWAAIRGQNHWAPTKAQSTAGQPTSNSWTSAPDAAASSSAFLWGKEQQWHQGEAASTCLALWMLVQIGPFGRGQTNEQLSLWQTRKGPTEDILTCLVYQPVKFYVIFAPVSLMHTHLLLLSTSSSNWEIKQLGDKDGSSAASCSQRHSADGCPATQTEGDTSSSNRVKEWVRSANGKFVWFSGLLEMDINAKERSRSVFTALWASFLYDKCFPLKPRRFILHYIVWCMGLERILKYIGNAFYLGGGTMLPWFWELILWNSSFA